MLEILQVFIRDQENTNFKQNDHDIWKKTAFKLTLRRYGLICP